MKKYPGKDFAGKEVTLSTSDISFASMLSIKSEDLPEITRVPIMSVLQFEHQLSDFTEFQLLAEVKRRKMFQEERELLRNLVETEEAAPKRSGRGSPGRQQFYNVDKILERRGHKPNEFYRVHWEGYPENEGTWEPAENILLTEELIAMVTEFNMREFFTTTPYIEV